MQASQSWQFLYTCDTLTPFQYLCRAQKSCLLTLEPDAGQSSFWIACALVTIFSLGLPALFWLHIRRGLLYERCAHHDRWLRAIETEYMVGVSGYWSHHHYPLHSSVHRPWAMLLPASLLCKLALAWILAGTHGLANGVVARDVLVLAILSLNLAALCVWPSFRLPSSRFAARALLAGNVVSAGVRALMSAGFTSNVFLLLGVLLAGALAPGLGRRGGLGH